MSDCTIAAPGIRNLRDFGGYATSDGRMVRRGLLFRSGHPAEATAAGRAALAALGLRTIVDLRTTEERESHPYPAIPGDADYWARDYALSRGAIVSMLRDGGTTVAAIRTQMLDNYRRLIDEQSEGISAALLALSAGRAPILINCTMGKDRTGVCCAVILSALGVPDAVIRADYRLTEEHCDPAAMPFAVDPQGPFAYLLSVDPAVWRTMTGSPSEYIEAALAELRTRFGGIHGYLGEVHGFAAADVARLKDALLEDGVASGLEARSGLA